jgi:glyoxylase-like metal-dependent hydrolase (beta-lactamase superfamily II)
MLIFAVIVLLAAALTTAVTSCSKGVIGVEKRRFEVYSGADGTCNAGIVQLANRKVMVIDTLYWTTDGPELKRRAEAFGDVTYVVTTHEHFDHTGNNSQFDCQFVSSNRTKNSLVTQMQGPYTRTYDGQLELDEGEKVVIRQLEGHGIGPSVVYFPERKLLFTGDLVFEGPAPDVSRQEYESWIASLQEMEAWEVDTVVPGHGKAGGKDLLVEERAKLGAKLAALASGT